MFFSPLPYKKAFIPELARRRNYRAKRDGFITELARGRNSSSRRREGFTLLEVLLVVSLLGILAAITIVALNPSTQLAKTNNAQRGSDINAVLNGVWQYSLDNEGVLPASVLVNANCAGTADAEVCKTGGNCDGGTNIEGQDFTDLSVLTTDEEYLVSIPVDPVGATTNGTGYHVVQSVNGRVTVCAPDAQLGETIEVKK
jgi:prepilin-type N-terminal cleavage/methylation domain-containing protein